MLSLLFNFSIESYLSLNKQYNSCSFVFIYYICCIIFDFTKFIQSVRASCLTVLVTLPADSLQGLLGSDGPLQQLRSLSPLLSVISPNPAVIQEIIRLHEGQNIGAAAERRAPQSRATKRHVYSEELGAQRHGPSRPRQTRGAGGSKEEEE